ncbi:MAG: hypothetical protein ACTS6A_00290 [Candidatus Hodgkinia cicadicola]
MISNATSFCKTLSKVTKIIKKVPFYKGKLVIGNVVLKGDEFALVDIGFTQNAILINNGSWDFENLTNGALIKVYIEHINEDEVIVSRRKLDEGELWDKLDNLHESKTEVEAKVVGFTRRGIKLNVFGMFGAIFWNKELIDLEIELRSKPVLVTRIRAICKKHNMVILSPARRIENTFRRIVKPIVWTEIIDLCDKGIWTHVDACNGIILLSGKPWCNALNLINLLPFGKIILSDFVSLRKLPKPSRSGDYVDLLVNFVAEVDEAINWDRNVLSINTRCVREWITSLALMNRDRWCDWRNLSEDVDNNRFSSRSSVDFDKPKLCNELKFELFEVNGKQNLMWDKEQTEILNLLCGFDLKKFETTQFILKLMHGSQLNFNDKTWHNRINNAWTWGTKVAVSGKVDWRRTFPLIDREHILKNLRNKIKHSAWREELEWEDEQNLIETTKGKLNEEEIEVTMPRGRKPSEAERRQNEIKSINSYFERLNRNVNVSRHNEDDWNENSFNYDGDYENVENDQTEIEQSIDVERKLNSEWNSKWHLEREQNYWHKQYAETDCSLIETNYGKWNDIRILRPVYAVIVGMDIQVTLLVAAITSMLLMYICDFSLTDNDVKMLQNDWGNSLAIKVSPIGLSYSLDDTLVEVDINGYNHLHFVVENVGLPLIGSVVKVGINDVTIKLTNEVVGKLRFNISTDNFGIEVGMEIDVMIADFNPIENDINLELTEEELVRTILVEA